MDVTKLVMEMQETLSTIHTTLASLNTSEHDAKLDELELKRDTTIKQLLNDFTAESEALTQKRQAEREEIAERRRREDEEREIRRRLEDEQLASRDHNEDEVRDNKLLAQTNVVEEETDTLMAQIEEEAQRAIEEGHQKLKALEEKRQELNRLIDEQLKAPLPQAPRRRSRRGSSRPPAVAAESKPPESMPTPESINNSENKALEPQNTSEDEGLRPALSAVSPPAQETMVKETDSVQPSPRAVMDEQASENEAGFPDARQLERHLRPLFVHPVISKGGDIIHAEKHTERKPPVEPIGIPTRDLAASEILQSPKRDVTWWEEKRKAEAQALQAEADALERRDGSPPAVHDGETPNQVHEAQALPTVPQDAGSEGQETLPPTVFDGNLEQMEGYPYPEEKYNGGDRIQQESFAPQPKHHEPTTEVIHSVETDESAKIPEAASSPADIPLPSSASRGSMSSNEGDTSFEPAREHTHPELHAPSAISDHTKSHENDHVSFTEDTLDSYHDSYPAYNSRDTSVLRTESSATPEREFSSEADENEVYSVSSHGNHGQEQEHEHEHQQVPEVIVREAAKVALPPEMEDSCSISESSDHPPDVEIDAEDPLKHRRPGITDVGDVDEEEVTIPLERVPSRQPGPELHDHQPHEVEHRTELYLPPPTAEDMELRSPLLMPIPENEQVHHRMDEDPLNSLQEQAGLGIRDNQPVSESLHHVVDHEESSDDDGVSHHHFDEDDYMHPDSTMSVQPFRTDRSDRRSLAGDGGVQELKDNVGGPDERYAESDCSDRGSAGDHAHHGLLPGAVGVGFESQGEVEDDSHDAVHVAESAEVMADDQNEGPAEHEALGNAQLAREPTDSPMPSAASQVLEVDDTPVEFDLPPGSLGTNETHRPPTRDLDKQMVETITAEDCASVEMDMTDAPPVAGEQCSLEPHEEGEAASADSEVTRREEDMAHTPVVPSQDTELQNVQGGTDLTVSEGDLPGANITMTETPVAFSPAPSPSVHEDGDMVAIEREEGKSNISPAGTPALSRPQSLYDHNQLGLRTGDKQPLPPTEMHSPAAVYPKHESLADQLRRASREEESEDYEDDESSQLERTDEYTTTVHGEAGLFDDDSDDVSGCGEERHAEEEMRDNGRQTPTDAHSYAEPIAGVEVAHQQVDEHHDQPDTPTGQMPGQTQASVEAAPIRLDEREADTATEKLAAELEALAQAAEENVEASQDTHAPSPAPPMETDLPVQNEDSSADKDHHLLHSPVNEPPIETGVPAQVDIHNDDDHPGTATLDVTSSLEIQAPDRVEGLHVDTQQQLYPHPEDSSTEAQAQAIEKEVPQTDGLGQQAPAPHVGVEPPARIYIEEMADEPELLQLAAPVPTLELPEHQKEAHRRRSWVEETDEYFDDSEEEEHPSAETPLMHSIEPPTQISQQSSSSIDKGLAASRHNPNRPQTPEEEEEQDASADRTNPSWHTRNASSPQSTRSGSTLSSAPSSPAQTRDTHEPVIRGLVDTHAPSYTGRPRNDSSLTEYTGRPRNGSSLTEYNPHDAPEPQPKTHFSPGPLASRWGPSGHLFDRDHDSHRKSDISSGSGSLFQRMRSVFEPAQSDSGYNYLE
ncbi:hypothetical protein QBC44DRAFT_373582 [Cladorrhinum sp. PSN332]|nr:hypothetical protein QBC44DRAFT_373582 [Cladorrhinum sp. PSN332]